MLLCKYVDFSHYSSPRFLSPDAPSPTLEPTMQDNKPQKHHTEPETKVRILLASLKLLTAILLLLGRLR